MDDWWMFVNADELIDTSRFNDWWTHSGTPDQHDAILLASDVYSDSNPTESTGRWEPGVLLIRKPLMQRVQCLHGDGRYYCVNKT